MHWLIVSITLLANFYTVPAQSRVTVPSPPTYPTETGPPRDFNNCRINADSALSWVVSVWDTAQSTVVGHGSMLTYIIFFSTCRQYYKAASDYTAHGQQVWDASSPLNPCMQEAEIESITRHPECTNHISEWSPYDFSIFKLKKPFEIAGAHYPMIPLPLGQDVLMDYVHHLNSLSATKGCFLFAFRNHEERLPVFNLEAGMDVIPFHEECVKLLCEMNPPDPSRSAECESQFSDRKDSTMICVKNKTDDTISLPNNRQYWIAGAPFYCNCTIYGIASQPKLRSEYPDNPTDFHFVATFFHVIPWLKQQSELHSAPWQDEISIGNKDVKHKDDPRDGPVIPNKPNYSTFPPFFPPESDCATPRTPSLISIIHCFLLMINSLKYFR